MRVCRVCVWSRALGRWRACPRVSSENASWRPGTRGASWGHRHIPRIGGGILGTPYPRTRAGVSSGHGILRIPRYPGDTVSSGYHWHPGDTAASSGCHWCPADSRISLRTCTYIGVITSGEKSACIKEIGRHHGFRPNKSGVPCFLTPTCKLRHMESTRRSWRSRRVTGKSRSK